MDWHELVGKRVKATEALLFDPHMLFRTVFYTFLFGTCELISAWLVASSKQEIVAEHPPVFDLLDPCRSIVQSVTQFFSALLLAEPPMIMFLSACMGVPSLSYIRKQSTIRFRNDVYT